MSNSLSLSYDETLEPMNISYFDEDSELLSSAEATTSSESFVWKYFTKKKIKNKLVAACSFCNTNLKIQEDGSTSSFKRHLATKYKNKVLELKRSNIIPDAGIIVLDMLKNNASINHNHEGLRDIFTYLEPCATAPSSDLIKRHITSNFEEECIKLQNKLQEVLGRVSLTTDIWTTDTNDKSFIRHTGVEIANYMEECLWSLGIISKVIAIIRDNVSANNKFLQKFSDSVSQSGIWFDDTQQSIRCFGHILNLAIQCMFKNLEDEILIKCIRRSKILHKKNSTYDMCKHAIVLQIVLNTLSYTESDLHQYVLSEENWKKIKLLTAILLPFKDAIVKMLKQEYLTLSMVILFYYTLIETLKEAIRNKNTPQWLVKGCKDAMTKLLDYCEKTNILILAAVILNPRLKLEYFQTLGWPL
ncbi:7137_t:CDS:2 [Cetraspora pellucida]|uniref:7137_t:CDS:1 n=1 Tax=Cetraspora pellucida TaxID=1433469 RepID=A0A9N9I989_9GLOM|nr:7137_t:CDS:2 [Cetraspora pellucida]